MNIIDWVGLASLILLIYIAADWLLDKLTGGQP